MDSSKQTISDMLTLLQLIPQQGEGIGWYFLEKILARRGHSISIDGNLMPLLKKLENDDLIESKQVLGASHPRYILTDKGVKWLETHEKDQSE